MPPEYLFSYAKLSLMQKIGLILVVLIGSCFLSSRSDKSPGLVIARETGLIIHGQTNVNSFKCKLAGHVNGDTLTYTTDDDGCMIFFKDNKMNIPIRDFDCANKMINKDFAEVLKAESYPNIQIQFVALERWAGAPNIGGTAFITLAGVTKPFTIYYDVKSTDRLLHLNGNKKISFSDFGLKAPEKMMGLIKVQDKLEVEFHLVLKVI